MHQITNLNVTIEATQKVPWPHFAGSTLRGAFGRALRNASCVTKQQKCNGCSLRKSCSYGVVFDPDAPTKPFHPSFRDGIPRYVLQPPPFGAAEMRIGQKISFNFIFLPGSESYLKFIEHVLKLSVENELISDGVFKLVKIESQRVNVNEADSFETNNSSNEELKIAIRWLTPLRLQQYGKPIDKPHLLDMHVFIRALLRRRAQWCQLTDKPVPDATPLLAAASRCRLNTNLLRWHDIERFSNSQNKKIPIGGLMGLAELFGPRDAIQLLMPLLSLVQQIHIGKQTVFGLGRYELEVA
jgi:CRISPR/Cas system endoribonuclease Cas6 (RAMP superfamily)